jgi:hypothetical protein
VKYVKQFFFTELSGTSNTGISRRVIRKSWENRPYIRSGMAVRLDRPALQIRFMSLTVMIAGLQMYLVNYNLYFNQHPISQIIQSINQRNVHQKVDHLFCYEINESISYSLILYAIY